MNDARQYIAIDLKSFYASVECVERGLDPLDACLVVADASRTDKTICLAVSPALKAFGVGGRPRLFEVVSRVKEVNRLRGAAGSARFGRELAEHPELALDYFVAKPRMALYIEYSARIYGIYLRHIAPEDIHVYSIDEVFIDATPYLKTYRTTAHGLAMRIIRDVLAETGITATAGVGTNLYLCKVAMDIVAKKMQPDADGVRIAELNEQTYRRELWNHKPLTDFWRVGRGIAARLAAFNIHTMGDIARCSVHNESLLYQLFGINAELLIDHAWGWEPVGMDQVRAYQPESHSISTGQVLASAYSSAMALNVATEMADDVALDLVAKKLLAKQIVLTVSYDSSGFERHTHAHGTENLPEPTSSAQDLIANVRKLFNRIVDKTLLIRRITICITQLADEDSVGNSSSEGCQLDLFTDYNLVRREQEQHRCSLKREHRRQQTILKIKQTFGKNAILKGLNYTEGATQRQRNTQIGGHNA